MAFFPRSFYNADTSFTPLFRLLDDFDSYTRQSGGRQHGGRCATLPSWQPKFDVRETAENYELHGELPGMSKENVHIEFSEPQTMLIRGKVERTYSAGTPPTGQVEDAVASGAITAGEGGKASHKATVEDEDAANNQDSTYEVVQKQTEEQKPADKAKYWLTERSIGEFSRSFNFPARIDQENVSADFSNGILSIVVPKAKAHESRRITIN